MDEMIHGTPSQPDIDGGPIDQDEGTPLKLWVKILIYLAIALTIIFTIYIELKFPGHYDGSGNHTSKLSLISRSLPVRIL